MYWSLERFSCLCMLKKKGLVGFNKRSLNLTVRAPGSTHHARFFRNTGLFKQILNGQGLPDKTVDLGDEYGKIPLVTTGDSTSTRFSWLLNNFNCNTNDERERYCNIKMNSARVVTENCYGILKSCWRILYKKQDQRFSVLNIIMAYVMFHNFCIVKHDSYNPRWRLSVNSVIKRKANKGESNKNARKIADCLNFTFSKLQTLYYRFFVNIFVY